jgi:hypothetical protein
MIIHQRGRRRSVTSEERTTGCPKVEVRAKESEAGYPDILAGKGPGSLADGELCCLRKLTHAFTHSIDLAVEMRGN